MAIKSRTFQKNIKEELNDNTVIMREISGMGIQQQEDVSDVDLMNLIQATNHTNIESANSTVQEIKRLQEEEKEKQLQLEEEERKRQLKERYEKELELRTKKEEEERLEEERLAKEEEERKKKSLSYKVSNIIKPKKKKENNISDLPIDEQTSDDFETFLEETVETSYVDDLNDEENQIDSIDDISNDILEINILDDILNMDDHLEESTDENSDFDFSNVEIETEEVEPIVEPASNESKSDLSNSNINSEDEDIFLEDLFYEETTKEPEASFSENTEDFIETQTDEPELSEINETPEPISEPVSKKEKKQKKERPAINININIGNPFAKKEKKEKQNSKQDEEIERLKFAAYNDDMTGLLNKKSYKEKISSLKIKPGIAVIYFDVNNLKLTNDTIGHEAGDSLIAEAAGQIKEKFPNEGYRTGGDEFVAITEHYKEKEIKQKIEDIHQYLKNLTDTNKQGIRYAVSIGYAIAKKHSTFEELMHTAEEQMYTNKKAYKEALKKELGNQYVDPRASDKEIMEAKNNTTSNTSNSNSQKELSDEQYDNLLTKEQRELKQRIQYQHEPANKQSIAQIMAQIQSKSSEIEAILIADKNFNNLFILQDINSFIRIVQQMELNLDFTYLYVLFRGGPQYFGIDEYTSEITHLFENISGALLKRQIKQASDLQKIKGINIFKQIHADF